MTLIHQGFRVLLAFLVVLSLGATGAFPLQSLLAAPNPAGLTLARKPAPIPMVAVTQLPIEAQQTIRLIQKGGPFPYGKDGTTFGNRERRLPPAPYGYYREYTVPTPGSPDRGPRRIVTGESREFYYTKDHYESFVKVKF